MNSLLMSQHMRNVHPDEVKICSFSRQDESDHFDNPEFPRFKTSSLRSLRCASWKGSQRR